MADEDTRVFIEHLLENKLIDNQIDFETEIGRQTKYELSLRKVWQVSQMSAGSFADQVSSFFARPRVNLPDLLAADSLAARFSRRFLREAAVYPFRTPEGAPRLAVFDPTDQSIVRAAEIVLGSPPDLVVASFEDITTVLAERLGDDEAAPADETRPAATAGDDVESLRDLASGAPVVRAVNDLIERALELRATDIHIEPNRTGLVVRMRVDGLLRVVPTPPGAPAPALISRIKILAGLNIAERRLPQDGGARLRVAHGDLDIRVATMPTQHGESAVIRLLPRDRGLLEIERLGLTKGDEAKLQRLLALPHGMIVVTGPTGSGKTTTLATALTILNRPTTKILTIEDPVEYQIQGISQVNVNVKAGLTFASGLRAALRSDPDIVMIGEIRDGETAQIAIEAALTGHLVLSTLHTNDAATTVTRLAEMGVEPFLTATALEVVVNQRLARRVCTQCAQPVKLSAEQLRASGFNAEKDLEAMSAVGCSRCSGGYKGRVGLYEVLPISETIRSMILERASAGEIEEQAVEEGMDTLRQAGLKKIEEGATTVEEVSRVTGVT